MQRNSLVNQAWGNRRLAAARRTHCQVVRSGVLAVLTLAALAGCTTLKAVDLPPEQLRNALRNGEVAPHGETVVLVTANSEHTVEFVEVDVAADVVRGRADDGAMAAVAVEDIFFLKLKEEAAGRSTLLGIAIAFFVVGGLVAADAAEDMVDLADPSNW